MCLHTRRVSEHLLVGFTKVKLLEIKSFSFRESYELCNPDEDFYPVLCADTLRVCRHKTENLKLNGNGH